VKRSRAVGHVELDAFGGDASIWVGENDVAASDEAKLGLGEEVDDVREKTHLGTLNLHLSRQAKMTAGDLLELPLRCSRARPQEGIEGGSRPDRRHRLAESRHSERTQTTTEKNA
jgi:hypothetical protein